MQRQLVNADFAVLYRTNSQSRAIEDALRKRDIAYRIFGGLSFYQRKEIKDLLDEVLKKNNLAGACLSRIATIDLKADEPGILALANRPLIRSSFATRPTKSSTTAVMAGFPPRRSYNEASVDLVICICSVHPDVVMVSHIRAMLKKRRILINIFLLTEVKTGKITVCMRFSL